MSTERPHNDEGTPRDHDLARDHDTEGGHEPAAASRRRSPLAIASVAAAVLLVCGGGAYVAASASGGDSGRHGSGAGAGDDKNPPPLALDGYSDGDRGADKGGGSPGIAPGEPNPYGPAYTVKGSLPSGPDEAPVYRPHGSVTAAEVTRLAKALGLSGTPRMSAGAWTVGPGKDGTGPSLQVTRQAPGTWTFTRFAPGQGDNCPRGKMCVNNSPTGGTGGAVSESAAKAAAAPVLKALGQDDAKLDARQLMGAVRVVNADPVIGGLPTFGWSTGLQIGAGGQVVGGSGELKAPAKGDIYPVMDAERTLELLNKSGHGSRMHPDTCARPVPLERDRGTKPTTPSCAPGAPTQKPSPIVVEHAVFGLATHFEDGHQTLVPSWLFRVKPQGAADDYTVSYPAVDPKFMSSPKEPGNPTGNPTGRPNAGPRDARIASYSADGRKLTVHFWGGVCSDYRASAKETGSTVTVKVTGTDREPGKACIMIAKDMTKTVTLDKPLGHRKVLDDRGTTVRAH
ncbi:hypothetical protein ACWCP6_00165 [Streptomyces sp. NPDC002004]